MTYRYDFAFSNPPISHRPFIYKGWLPRMDSNHDKQIQNLLCYRYTTRQ